MSHEDKKSIKYLLSRTLVSQAIGILRNLWILPLLSLGDLGIYKYLFSLFAFANYAHLGAVTVVGFKAPYYQEHQDKKSEQELYYTALVHVVYGFLVATCIYAGLLYFKFQNLTFVSIAPFGALGVWVTLINTQLKVWGKFAKMAQIDMLANVIGFGFLVLLGWSYGLWGFILASFVPPVIVLCMGAFQVFNGYNFNGISYSKRYLKYGLNLFTSGFLNQFVIGIDFLLLGFWLPVGDYRVGLYGFAYVPSGIIVSYLGSLSEVFGQRMIRDLATVDKDNNARIFELITKNITRDLGLSVILGAIVCIVVRVFVEFYLTTYKQAILVLVIICVATYFLRIRNYPVLFFNIKGKMVEVYLASAIGIIVEVIGLILVKNFWGHRLEFYGFVTVLAYWSVNIYIFIKIGRYLENIKEWLMYLGKVFICTLPLFLHILAMIEYQPPTLQFSITILVSSALTLFLCVRILQLSMSEIFTIIIPERLHKNFLKK